MPSLCGPRPPAGRGGDPAGSGSLVPRTRAVPVGEGEAHECFGRPRAARPLVARRELPVRRPDLPARQPAAAPAAGRARTSSRGCSATGGPPPASTCVWTHLNRLIRERDVDAIFLAGPGHGGPAAVANAWLEGTYSEVYPHDRRRRAGDARAVPAVLLPRRDPEPRRAGDARLHPRGRRARLRPLPRVRRRDGQPGPAWSPRWSATASSRPARWPRPGTPTSSSTRSTTARCCRSCTSTATRSPTRPSPPGSRATELESLLRGYGHEVLTVEGDDPMDVHRQMAAALDTAHDRIREIQRAAREDGDLERRPVADDPAGHAQGLDRPGGGRRRARSRAPGGRTRCRWPAPATTTSTGRCSRSGCGPTAPTSSSTTTAGCCPELRALAPVGHPADERQPARQRRPARAGRCELPDFREPRGRGGGAGRAHPRADPGARPVPRRRGPRQRRQLPDLRAGRDRLQPARRGLRGDRQGLRRRDPGQRRAPRPVRPGGGDALRAHLPGLARGLPAHRPARAVQLLRGVHPPRRLDAQPARQVAEDDPRDRVASADRLAQLPAHLARLAPGPQRLLPPGPRLHRPRGQQEGRGRPGLPAAGHQHAAVDDAALPGQPALRQRRGGRQAAVASTGWTPRQADLHCARGLGIWDWASNDDGDDPDVVLACAGDVPTLEALAAAALLREHLPDAEGAVRQRRRPDAAAGRRASTRTA